MIYRKSCFILFLVIFLVQFISVSATNTEMESIMEEIRKWNVVAPNDSVIVAAIDGMDENGKYSDIDYSLTVKSGWTPQFHFTRLQDLAYAYISPDCKWFADEVVYQKITKGIEYWLSSNAYSVNWFEQMIREPEYFGRILICMRVGHKQLPLDLESAVIEKWRNNGADPKDFKTSNQSKIALNWMYFACLLDDKEILEKALYYLFLPIAFSDQEGFQVDNSFFQHGAQLYIGGYGETMLESVLQTAVCVKDTKYKLSDEKLKLIRNYVLDTYSNVIRGTSMNWTCSGRTIARSGNLNDIERIPIFNKLMEVDKTFYDDYLLMKNRYLGLSLPSEGVKPYHSHLFRGDFTVHVRPSYSFSVRMLSTRTVRQECLNGENLLGYFVSDGAAEVSCYGDEYTDLMPLWDWNTIPGVTAPILDSIPRIPDDMYVYGSSTFSGGVSDSIYGCSAYKYYDEYSGVNTGASKGYFFFDDEVICLGAGIKSDHEKVYTTINQCWGENSFIVDSGNGTKEYMGNIFEPELKMNKTWILHDGIGYYFPDPHNVSVENRLKIGNWRRISSIEEDREITGKVFSLSISHPSGVEEGKYSYFVIPNSTLTSLSSYLTNNQVEILANTDSVQIVHHKGLHIIECIFYKACQFIGENMSIKSLQPCALIIKDREKDIMVHIADPSQSKRLMTIGIQLKDMNCMEYMSCDFSNLEDVYAGISKVMVFQKVSTKVSNVSSDMITTFLSLNSLNIILERRNKGICLINRLDGTTVRRLQFDTNHISFDFDQKGLFLLNIMIDGKRYPIIRKILVN